MLKLLQSNKKHVSSIRHYKTIAGYFGSQPKQDGVEKVVNDFQPRSLEEAKFAKVVQTYRDYGYLYANKDPLNIYNKCSSQLRASIEKYKSDVSYDVENLCYSKPDKSNVDFTDFVDHLTETYCSHIGYDVQHLLNVEEKEWFYKKAETSNSTSITDDNKIEIGKHLMKSQILETFLARKFPSFKRYSGEGAESMLAFFHGLFGFATGEAEEILLSNSHRGKTALLTLLLDYPYRAIFHKIKGNGEFAEKFNYVGDVVSHLKVSNDITYGGKNIHVSMVPNPSHLELGNPVVVGKARGKYLTNRYGPYGDNESMNKVLCVQIHGDAAFAGQGVVMETLCFASLPHFDVGGSIHLIVNNQLGFTTPCERGTSATSCSDIGKAYNIPVLHANGDHPEELVKAAKIAYEYRRTFNKDIIVNMYCFRRWGHNELDDPTMTNPSVYQIVHNRETVPNLYKKYLIENSIISENEMMSFEKEFSALLNTELDVSEEFHSAWDPFEGDWKEMIQADKHSTTLWNTGYNASSLSNIGLKSVEVPDHITVHKNLQKSFVQVRQKRFNNNEMIDWATAESLAIGSLLMDGHHVRMCGQDVGRGTFSHRHTMLVDQNTDEVYIPLNNISEQQKGFLEVVNSPLSEESVLGFEYGMSCENPNHLIIWEAQFGDFWNCAQNIVDTFIASGETKWLTQSGLVMLLPHGMDGGGPDHSSSRIERLLQMSDSREDVVDGDDVNIEIANPTTPAQYFHLLRRQMVRNFRKPLIIASPKIILRLPAAVSSLSEMTSPSYFRPVICDEVANPNDIKKIIFCCGKHYYDLKKLKEERKNNNTVIVRLEALTPFPAEELKNITRIFPHAQEFIWSQEEHRNQGAWSFINPRFQNLLNIKLNYNGRQELAASAVGVPNFHSKEIIELFKNIFD